MDQQLAFTAGPDMWTRKEEIAVDLKFPGPRIAFAINDDDAPAIVRRDDLRPCHSGTGGAATVNPEAAQAMEPAHGHRQRIP